MDYNRSNVASRERSAALVNHNEDLLHDWKAFRENIREKVGRVEQ